MTDKRKDYKKERLEAWQPKKETLSFESIDIQKQNRRGRRKRILKQGEIYVCIVGENIGSEMRGPEPKANDESINHARPALVISKEHFNKDGLVTVIPLTSSEHLTKSTGTNNKKAPKIKNNYILREEKYDFLRKNSVIAPNQIRSLSSVRLNKYLGYIDDNDKAAIKSRLDSFFGM